jgi:phosphatidylinositol glycan class W
MVAAVLWGTLFIVLHWVQPVSRRACNLPYVVWSLTLNWTMLVLFVCGSLLSRVSAPLDLMSACSSNMLPLFLLANLITGAVNLMLDSLLVPNMQAIGIVCFYMVLVCCIAFALHSNNIQLKVGSKQANGNVTKHA